MIRMKKISIVLSLALILSVLASCDISLPPIDSEGVESEYIETGATTAGEEQGDATEKDCTDDNGNEVTESSAETTKREETTTRVEETTTKREETTTKVEETTTRVEETTTKREEATTRVEETTTKREETTTKVEETTTKAEETTTKSEQTTQRTEAVTTETVETTTEKSEESTEPESNCDHTDKNDDGKCDECDISVIIVFDLYAINDLHGKIFDNDLQPGVDELTTYLKNAYKQNANTVVFSSGDMWQGTAESGLTFGRMMIDWMNELDFAFMTIGNHEFDWGEKYVEDNAPLAEFPFLAINLYDSTTNQREKYCQPSVMIDLGEVQIGFIGAVGDNYSSISGEMQSGFKFITGSSLTSLVKAESQRLRSAGADFIVYSIHDDDAAVDPALTSGGYVDVVFEAHTHQAYVNTDANGVYHIQGGGENSGISYVSVSINFANMNSDIEEIRVIKSSEYSRVESDDIVDELKEKYEDEMLLIESTLGYNESQRNSSYIEQLVAQLYADLGEAHWPQYNVVLGGGKINCRSPYNLYSGNVTYGDLYSLLPFNNKLALCSIKGSDLLSRYINSSSYSIGYTAYGESEKNNIDSNATYYIIADSYNYTYAYNKLTVVEILDDTTFARDLLAQYIKNGGLGSQTPSGGNETTTPPDVSLTSIPKLLEYAYSLAAGKESAEAYYVKGTITSIVQSTYGNMYIEDENGNSLYVYGVNEDGVRYGSMSDKPQVGDTVILYGKMKNYVYGTNPSVYEMISAELIWQN